MTGGPTETGRDLRRRRWLGIGLAVSLGLNLLLIGFVVARAVYPVPRMLGPHMTLYHAAEELSPESRDIVRRVMKARSDDFHAHVRGLKQERRRLNELMMTERLDEAAVAQSLREIRRHNAAIQEEIHAATLEIARQLSADERKRLNLRLGEYWRKHKKTRGMHREEGAEAR